MIIHENYGTFTTSTGTAAVTLTVDHDVLQQLFIQPTTATTSYDVKITNTHGLDVLEREDQVGTTNELKVGLPLQSNITLTISNATNDEQFTYLLAYKDE